jgi:hypothetical protein
MPDEPLKKVDDLLRSMATESHALKQLAQEYRDDFTESQIQGCDKKLAKISETLLETRCLLDPAKHEIITISLGRPDALSRFFAFSFVEKELRDFSGIGDSKFYGSGVYALYYAGDQIEPYRVISGTETPIYVGKAVPASPSAETAFDQGPAVWKRLKEHKKSIVAGGLDPSDFKYRYAVIQSGMESAVEDFMIRLFLPIWNKEIKVCFGIGKHGDAATTRANKRSPWDTMHPGRRWAEATEQDQSSREEIITKIAAHFVNHPPIADKTALHHVLAL